MVLHQCKTAEFVIFTWRIPRVVMGPTHELSAELILESAKRDDSRACDSFNGRPQGPRIALAAEYPIGAVKWRTVEMIE
jgi:hypothetical protein